MDALCRKLTAPWVRERALQAGGARHTGVKTPADTSAAAPGTPAAVRALPNSGAVAAAAVAADAAAAQGPPMARAVPAVHDIEDAIDVCGFYEGYTAAATDAVLPPGVYTLQVGHFCSMLVDVLLARILSVTLKQCCT